MAKRADVTTAMVLTAIHEHYMDAYEHLAKRFPPKVVIAAFYRDNDRGLIDYGVSATRPFLTPEGRAALGVPEPGSGPGHFAELLSLLDEMRRTFA
ncbi:hypothetical protein [Streptodolium elevatio]|uniref:Uncharacterized protein n=1 Tax=Streptodolium elevatio TaxID=3157996 RepID=A0ABV3DK07_9ACTN